MFVVEDKWTEFGEHDALLDSGVRGGEWEGWALN